MEFVQYLLLERNKREIVLCGEKCGRSEKVKSDMHFIHMWGQLNISFAGREHAHHGITAKTPPEACVNRTLSVLGWVCWGVCFAVLLECVVREAYNRKAHILNV